MDRARGKFLRKAVTQLYDESPKYKDDGHNIA